MDPASKPDADCGRITVRPAAPADVDNISRLVNDAFNPERFFIDGDRTSPEKIATLFRKGNFLLAEESGKLVGCVYIELRGERGYFGLLSVEPGRQSGGLGTQLMNLAEEKCCAAGCRVMDLTVVNLRTPLLSYYKHRGYVEDGTLPFPNEQPPPKVPCHLIKMTKPLT